MRQASSTSHRRAGTQLIATQLHQISPSITALPCRRQHSRQHHATGAHTLDACTRSAAVACREHADSRSNAAAAGHHAFAPVCMSHHRHPNHAQRCRRPGASQQLQAAAHVTARASEPHVSAAPTQNPSSTPPTSSAQPQQQQRPQQTAHWFDSLPEVQRYVHADEWGFSLVGSSLPTGVPISGLLNALPEAVLETDTLRAVVSLVAPLAVMIAGYGWLCYMHSITPWWQLLACWLAIGTAYTGLFQAAHECARGTFMPLHPRTQALLGSLIMAPSLFSLDAWRARVFNHTLTLNQLHGDTTAWHPVTVADVAAAGPMRRKWLRLITSTPLKLLSSIGEWVRSFQSWDLFTYYYELRQGVLLSWVAPALWLGLALPTLMTCAGGLAGVATYWLAPWLVFHLWLSTLTLTQHTAPHIPWRPARTHDLTRAVVSGTVTVPLPAWLELLLNHANYNLPQHVTFNGIPSYHAKAATQALREKLWPYMQEAPLTIRLITNHITRWQVYDTEAETYIAFEEALERIKAAEALENGHSPEPATAS